MSDKKNKMDKWLITAMSHMKTMHEDNGIPWSEEDEGAFQEIRNFIIQEKPENDEKYVEEKARGFIEKLMPSDEYLFPTRTVELHVSMAKKFITQIIKDARGRAKALNYAIDIIENYQLDIENSKESIGIDLVKKRFCQGRLYNDALNYIETLRKEEEGG